MWGNEKSTQNFDPETHRKKKAFERWQTSIKINFKQIGWKGSG
jgi:hypothetical protein